MNPFSLKDKNILITGASSGIGKICAIECAKMGANTILLARNSSRLQETIDEIESLGIGQKHIFYSVDFESNFNELDKIIEQAVSNFGKIDGFIHAAGIEKTLPINVMKSSDYESLFKVNVISGFELVKIISKKKNCFHYFT